MSIPTTQPQQPVAPAHLSDVISYQRSHVAITGNVTGAIFLSQLIALSPQYSHTEGWISKTQHEWQELTGMTRSEQDSARKSLRTLNLLEEARRGMPATLCVRLKYEQLEQVLPGSMLADEGRKLVCSEAHPADQILCDQQNGTANQFAENSKPLRDKTFDAPSGAPTATQMINICYVSELLQRLEKGIQGTEKRLNQLNQINVTEATKQSQSVERIEIMLVGLIILVCLILTVCVFIRWYQPVAQHEVPVKKASSAQINNAVRPTVK